MPTPTRLNETALYAHAARRVQWIIWPIGDEHKTTVARIQRLIDARRTIRQNLKSDCQAHRFLSR